MRDDELNSTALTYQVQYQEAGNSDWYIMTRRNHDERYRTESDKGMHEVTSLDEALDTAQALAKGYASPAKPGSCYWRRIVAAQVVTIVRVGQVSAVYGTPNVDVPRETKES